MGHYIYKSIPHAKFEVDSSSSFGYMTSQNFLQKKGTSHPIRLFYPRKTGLTLKKRVFMSRIVLLDPKLPPPSQFQQFSSRGKFVHFQHFLDISMTIEQQQPP